MVVSLEVAKRPLTKGIPSDPSRHGRSWSLRDPEAASQATINLTLGRRSIMNRIVSAVFTASASILGVFVPERRRSHKRLWLGKPKKFSSFGHLQ